jgi:hypothetical protein
MEVSGQLHALATLTLGKNSSTYWTEGWVDPRACLDTMVKRKIPFLVLVRKQTPVMLSIL